MLRQACIYERPYKIIQSSHVHDVYTNKRVGSHVVLAWIHCTGKNGRFEVGKLFWSNVSSDLSLFSHIYP